MTTQDIINYYADQLIIQYRGIAQNYAFIQALATPIILPCITVYEISFPVAPTSGQFVVSWDGNDSSAINWNDSAPTIQTNLQAISGLSEVTVSGSIAGLAIYVTMIGVPPIADPFLLVSNTLMNNAIGGDPLVTEGGSLIVTESGQQIVTTFETIPVVPLIEESDDTLPIQVQNAFNMTGATAVGVQLDTIGKYAGVTRTVTIFDGSTIVLDDSDFMTLIRMAIVRNSSNSSLAAIQQLLFQFFPNEVFVIDYANMHMSFMIAESVGPQNLIQAFVEEGLLPVPMGVGYSVIYAPTVTRFFGFVTYQNPTAINNVGFNTYQSYDSTKLWIDYDDGVSP